MAVGNPSEENNDVRILVAGDTQTGKSSLIAAALDGKFRTKVSPLLPPTTLVGRYYPGILTVIDHSFEDGSTLAESLSRVDVCIITYACDKYETIRRLHTYWLPELLRLEVKIPVLVVGCMEDKRQDPSFSFEKSAKALMLAFWVIEVYIECSALTNTMINEVFALAQKIALNPMAPLYDPVQQNLKPRCLRALKRIFLQCKHDNGSLLSYTDLNKLQMKYFRTAHEPFQIQDVKNLIEDKFKQGGDEQGITLEGFCFIQKIFIERGHTEATWILLKKFGYNIDLRLPSPLVKLYPDQSLELTNEAVEYLKNAFGIDQDGALGPDELDNLFSTAPENPWSAAPYQDALVKNPLGGLLLEGFLSQWRLMALLDPILTMETLTCIGYVDPSSAIHATRRRRLDRKKHQSHRSVLQCFVFGSKGSGKSSLLSNFVGRSFNESYIPTTEDQYAVNEINQPSGLKKTLVLREIREEGEELLCGNDPLGCCDVAGFVYDSSNKLSWEKAKELLNNVASKGEATGNFVPCLVLASKDDVDPSFLGIHDSRKVTEEMGIEAPIPFSSKRDCSDIFVKIVNTALQPHLNIPSNDQRKNINSYVFISVAIVAVCFAAYCEKNTCG